MIAHCLVYVSGPMTNGDPELNVREALRVAELILERGGVPYVPQLTHYWHLVYPHEHAFWLELHLLWLILCHALVRIPGLSVDADIEEAEARRLGLRIFVPTDLEKEDFTWR